MIEERRGILRRLSSVVIESEAVSTKVTLLIFAALQSLSFWWPPRSEDCPMLACSGLEAIMPWKWWGTCWAVYAVAQGWRILDGVHRQGWAMVVNGFGVFMFGMVAYVVTAARWPYLTLSIPQIVLALAAIWVMMRTAINPGKGFRGD